MPNPEDCANRIKHAEFGSHNYFFSWEYDVTKDLKVDWLTGRNICRRHCMDLVSIETRNENEFIKRRMIEVEENAMTALDNRLCLRAPCATSGRQAGSVTLPGVRERTSSQSSSTVGSGPGQE